MKNKYVVSAERVLLGEVVGSLIESPAMMDGFVGIVQVVIVIFAESASMLMRKKPSMVCGCTTSVLLNKDILRRRNNG